MEKSKHRFIYQCIECGHIFTSRGRSKTKDRCRLCGGKIINVPTIQYTDGHFKPQLPVVPDSASILA